MSKKSIEHGSCVLSLRYLKEGVITWRSGISCGGSSRGYCRRSDPQIWRSKMRICALQKRKETRRARQLNIQELNIPSVQMISQTIREHRKSTRLHSST